MTAQFIKNVRSEANGTKCIVFCAPNYVNRKQLLDMAFPEHDYIDMSVLKNRMYFIDAPMSIMQNFKAKIVLDNIQFCPGVLKFISDNLGSINNGQIIVSVNYKIYQTKHWTKELEANSRTYELPIVPARIFLEIGGTIESPIDSILTSNIPILSKDVNYAFDFYAKFLDDFIKTSVHLMHNISDPLKIVMLLRALAARIGKNVDLKELAEICELSVPTIREYIKVLELFYIIFPVYPYTKDYGKRIKKSTIYQFYNTGIACMLLNIRSQQDYVVSIFSEELAKCICAGIILVSANNDNNINKKAYYWKESYGHKIDLLIECNEGLKGYIFSDRINPQKRCFTEIARFSEISGIPSKNLVIVYPGEKSIVKNNIQLISWKDIV